MKRKLKRRILRLIALQLEAQRTHEGEWYFDPKMQRAFEGIRGELGSINKRLELLETPNVISLRRRR
jgi:hypothetical protein